MTTEIMANMVDFISSKGSRAVKAAQEQNKMADLPNIFFEDNEVYMETPMGDSIKSIYLCQADSFLFDVSEWRDWLKFLLVQFETSEPFAVRTKVK